MLGSLRRLTQVLVFGTACAWGLISGQVQAASPVALGIDGLIANSRSTSSGIFDTFTYGASTIVGEGSMGRYHSFQFAELDTLSGGGVNTNFVRNVDTPVDNFLEDVEDVNFTSDYFPLLDRAAFGTIFNPEDYQIEVEFRPLLTGPGPANVAPFFNIIIEQHDGFVVDDEVGTGKRAGEQFGYQVGSVDTDMDINTWWADNIQPNGFATWTMPVDTPTFGQKTFMFDFGDGAFRDTQVTAGDGREEIEDPEDPPNLIWVDDVDGPDYGTFGGDAIGAPNGAVQLHVNSAFGGATQADALNIEVKSVRVVPINKDPTLIARLDGESGISALFGSGFTNVDDVNIPGDVTVYNPVRTDQYSRFDENGLTNIVINTRTDEENNSFGLYGVADYQTFDGNEARVDIRAKLTADLVEGQTETLTLTLKDLDGDDMGGEGDFGAEEYSFNLDLNLLNTSTFTTISIPLTDFSLVTTADTFTNAGDGLLEDFNLYHMGGFISATSGLLDLEIEFMEVRLNVAGVPGDYNGDGITDAADYTVWRDAQENSEMTLMNRDPGKDNGTDLVDEGDYAYWRANFGATEGAGAGAGAAAAVPEPSTLLLAIWAVGLIGFLRRRSR